MNTASSFAKHALGALVAAVLLAGCSAEPSGSDIDGAMKRMFEQANKQQDLQGDFAVNLHSAKKLGCAKPDGDPGYLCDVEMEAKLPLQDEGKFPVHVRMVHGDDGWVAMMAGQ